MSYPWKSYYGSEMRQSALALRSPLYNAGTGQGKVRVVRTLGGMRRIPLSEVHRLTGEQEQRLPVLYARVSSHAQKDDLERQKERLQRTNPGAEMLSDIRSGAQVRPGFRSLLKAVQERRVSRVVVVHEGPARPVRGGPSAAGIRRLRDDSGGPGTKTDGYAGT